MTRASAWLRARRGTAGIVVLVLVLNGVGLLWTAHATRSNAQQRCASILAEARIPLPHPIAGNPSREWEAAFEAIEQQRARQLGCS